MVGALSLVGSSMVDSHSSPCLCVDSLTSNIMHHKSNGDLVTHMNPISKTHNLLLSSSFIDSRRFSTKSLSKSNNPKKQRKTRRLVIVNELAGQYEDSFEDVKTVRLRFLILLCNLCLLCLKYTTIFLDIALINVSLLQIKFQHPVFI